jgi:hypothetical protein
MLFMTAAHTITCSEAMGEFGSDGPRWHRNILVLLKLLHINHSRKFLTTIQRDIKVLVALAINMGGI